MRKAERKEKEEENISYLSQFNGAQTVITSNIQTSLVFLNILTIENITATVCRVLVFFYLQTGVSQTLTSDKVRALSLLPAYSLQSAW